MEHIAPATGRDGEAGDLVRSALRPGADFGRLGKSAEPPVVVDYGGLSEKATETVDLADAAPNRLGA